jgi:hypothetical protein
MMLNKNTWSQHWLDYCIISDVILTFVLQLETALLPVRIKDRVNEFLTVYELENLAHVTFSLTSKSIQSPWNGDSVLWKACPCTHSVISILAHTLLFGLLPLSAGDSLRKQNVVLVRQGKFWQHSLLRHYGANPQTHLFGRRPYFCGTQNVKVLWNRTVSQLLRIIFLTLKKTVSQQR